MPRKIRIQGHAKREDEPEVKAKLGFEKELVKTAEKNSVFKDINARRVEDTRRRLSPGPTPTDPRPAYTEGQSFPVVAVDGQLHRSADRLYVRTGGRWELVEEAVEGESMSSVHGPRSRVNGVGRCMSCRHWDYQSTDGLLVMGICTKNNTQAESDERPCSWAEPRVSEVGMNGRPRERGFIHFTLKDRLARWIFIGATFFVLAGITTQVLYGG